MGTGALGSSGNSEGTLEETTQKWDMKRRS